MKYAGMFVKCKYSQAHIHQEENNRNQS